VQRWGMGVWTCIRRASVCGAGWERTPVRRGRPARLVRSGGHRAVLRGGPAVYCAEGRRVDAAPIGAATIRDDPRETVAAPARGRQTLRDSHNERESVPLRAGGGTVYGGAPVLPLYVALYLHSAASQAMEDERCGGAE
jgi:hypothetical protein